MNAGLTARGLHHVKNESAGMSDVGGNAAREYANWGGEFVDDAFRFREQPFLLPSVTRRNRSSSVELLFERNQPP